MIKSIRLWASFEYEMTEWRHYPIGEIPIGIPGQSDPEGELSKIVQATVSSVSFL